jgi:signal transduction histidine kinase
MGYLLMLHEVTEQHQAQALVMEQQRAVAALHEREHLARDLHDSIGQVLGYASFQVEAANQLIAAGQTRVAGAQLTRLSCVLQDAHADVRAYILNLRAAPSPQQPFFTVVQHYLDGFMSNYDIETGLTLGKGLGEAPFVPEAQLQLFHILQEALTNARKHSQAHSVQVTFAAEDGRVQMRIADDGCGFDFGQAAAASGSHLGLRSMRERAEELGGDLRIESTPGAGTQVVVEVPRSNPAKAV